MTQTNDLQVMDDLKTKQGELMKAVPHPLREDSFSRMMEAKHLIEAVLLYLTSTGHKPWRPNPLSREIQTKRITTVVERAVRLLNLHSDYPLPSNQSDDSEFSRMLVSTFGGIEEIIEFFNSYSEGELLEAASEGQQKDEAIIKTRKEQLEELTDELFFFLERMILADFTWKEVVDEYYRKWEVNMKRYADAKKNDFAWDKRHEGKL